jgi:localization factor PodJL
MTRAAPWSIKGVGFDARQAAREAARRAGMSVGEWMNAVIAEQAAELGVDVEDFEDADRMEAVAGRLSRMSGRDDDADGRRWREGRARRPRYDDEPRAFEPRRSEMRRSEMRQAPGRRERDDDDAGWRDQEDGRRRVARVADAERLFEEAVDAFERRSARASSRAAAALASVADRLGDIEARLDDRAEGPKTDPEIRDSLGRLEERMEALARRAARRDRDQDNERDPVDGALRDLGQRLDKVVARLDRPRDAALDALERKLGAVLEAVNRPAVALQPAVQAAEAVPVAQLPHAVHAAPAASVAAIAASASGRPLAPSARPRVGRAPVADLVAEIERRQRDLDAPTPGRRAAGAPLSAETLDARLAEMSARFERVAEEAARNAARSAADAVAKSVAGNNSGADAQPLDETSFGEAGDRAGPRSEAARAAREVAQQAVREFSARLADAPQVEPLLRGLQDDLGRLAAGMDEVRRAAARPSAAGLDQIDDVRREIVEISERLHGLDARQPIAQLERAVRDLSRRVETSRADGASDAVTAPLAGLAEEMRAALAALDPRPGLAALEASIRDVARRFEGAARQPGGVASAELAALSAQNAEIRALLDKALTRSSQTDRVEAEIVALGQRLDRLAFAPAHVNPPEIAQAIGEIRAMMAAAVPTGSLDQLERRVVALADQVERLGQRRADAVIPEALERRLGALADQLGRLGETQGATTPPAAVKALERQIEGLAGRLDRLIDADPHHDGLGDALGEIRALMSGGGGAKALEAQIAGLAQRIDRMAADREPGAAQAMADAVAEMRAMMSGSAAPIARLETRLDELSERIAAPAAASAAGRASPFQEQALRELLGDISDRVSELRRPALQEETLTALRSEIGRLAERLDRAEDGAGDLAAVTTAVNGLMARLDSGMQSMRAAAAESAQEAAEQAARLALAQALDKGVASDAGEAIAALKAQQGEAERRSHATLGAVHDTLEKIVDRLAQIEDEIDERPAKVPAGQAARVEAARPAMARAVPDDGFGDEPLGYGQGVAQGQTQSPGRAAPAAVPSAVSALAEDLLIDPVDGRGPSHEDVAERRDAAAFIAAARRMTQQKAVETPAPPQGMAQRAAQAAQAARDAILAKTLRAEADGKAPAVKAVAAVAPDASDSAPPISPTPILDDDEDEAPAPARASLLARRKRPILIGLIGLTLALGALMALNFTPGSSVKTPAAIGLSKPAQKPAATSETTTAGQPTPNRIDAGKVEPGKIEAGKPDVGASDSSKSDSSRSDAGRTELGKPDAARTDMSRAAPQAADDANAGEAGPAGRLASGMSGAPPLPAKLLAPSKAAPAVAVAPAADGAVTASLGPLGPLVGSKALRDAAAGGDPAAAYETGLRFLEGRGGAEKDEKAAADWLERAARQGLAPAAYRLGALYEKGVGVARDPAAARVWYQRAADAGNARAMHNLAVLTAEGAGDKPDYAAAAQWFVKAAEYGVRDSQYNLAILYARGLGVQQNMALSYTWFATAARQGDQEAGRKRDEIATKLTPDMLATAKKAAELFRARALDRAANEVKTPQGGWDKADAGRRSPYGTLGSLSAGPRWA